MSYGLFMLVLTMMLILTGVMMVVEDITGKSLMEEWCMKLYRKFHKEQQ